MSYKVYEYKGYKVVMHPHFISFWQAIEEEGGIPDEIQATSETTTKKTPKRNVKGTEQHSTFVYGDEHVFGKCLYTAVL